MKTIYKKDLLNIIKDLNLHQYFWECWLGANRRSRDFNKWFSNVIYLMLFNICNINRTIHKDLGLSREARECYRILRNHHYNFSNMTTELGMKELKKLLKQYGSSSKSWKSRHKIFIVIDETLLRKTTNGFEEIKRLSGKRNENCYVVINIILIVNGKDYHLPLSQRILPADLGEKSKIDVSVEMIENICRPLKYSGYRLNGVSLIGDREYLCDKMNKVCRTNELTFECKMKRNSKIIYPDGLEVQLHKWIEQEKMNNFKDFKESSQLSRWCTKHKHLQLMYKPKIFDTKVLGFVKLIMTVPVNGIQDEKNIKVYVSTDLKKTAPNIIRDYREIRWVIERPFHYSLKNDFQIEKSFQGTSFNGLQNFYDLQCLGYFVIMKWKKNNRKASWTIGQIKEYFIANDIAVTNKNNNNCIRKTKKNRLRKFSKFKFAT